MTYALIDSLRFSSIDSTSNSFIETPHTSIRSPLCR